MSLRMLALVCQINQPGCVGAISASRLLLREHPMDSSVQVSKVATAVLVTRDIVWKWNKIASVSLAAYEDVAAYLKEWEALYLLQPMWVLSPCNWDCASDHKRRSGSDGECFL
eukprot:6437828-Amphidinium_carterae.1